MKKRIKGLGVISILMVIAMMLSFSACGTAQEPDNGSLSGEQGVTYKVGIIKYVDDASLDQIQAAIQRELDAQGETLGVSFEYANYTKNGQGDMTTLNQIAADLIADGVDILVPIATPAAQIVQAATEENQIPVVFSAVSDPVSAGLVESLEAPGANITGTSDALNAKAVIDLMLVADPDMKKLGILYDQGQDSSKQPVADAIAYCQEKGIETIEKTGTTNDELSLATEALIAENVDAVFTPTDNTVMTAELAIYEKFIEAGIPHYGGADSFALNGAFCGYGVNYVTLGTATADMVVDILVNGAKPQDTAVRIMSSGIAMVNTETAQAIGLDYSGFAAQVEELKETTTMESFS